mgnify:CR=1 FL=1
MANTGKIIPALARHQNGKHLTDRLNNYIIVSAINEMQRQERLRGLIVQTIKKKQELNSFERLSLKLVCFFFSLFVTIPRSNSAFL